MRSGSFAEIPIVFIRTGDTWDPYLAQCCRHLLGYLFGNDAPGHWLDRSPASKSRIFDNRSVKNFAKL